MSLCIVRVNFWAKEGKQLPSGWVNKRRQSFWIDVLAPVWWTLKIYLAALLQKVKWHKTLWLSKVLSFSCVQQPFNLVLDVHWLYECQPDEFLKRLTDNGALSQVEGGNLILDSIH
jgi:hypothetical protein